MNDAQLFSREPETALARLSEAERRVLWLLAEGHTAKSIAAELGITTSAVNERLREARRKTGVGSSRELARRFKAQENRHEQIGVGRGRSADAGLPQEDAEPWRPQTGVFAMVALLLLTAAGAAALMTQTPAATNEVDPLVGEALPRGPQIADLHSQVRAEARDEPWAGRIEGQIEARLMSLPLVGKDGNVLRVTCARTLCEIAGTLIAPASKQEALDPRSLYGQTIQNLQVSPLTEDLTRLGLKSQAGLFTGGKGKPDRTVFLLYYSRAAKP